MKEKKTKTVQNRGGGWGAVSLAQAAHSSAALILHKKKTENVSGKAKGVKRPKTFSLCSARREDGNLETTSNARQSLTSLADETHRNQIYSHPCGQYCCRHF
jgi:exo-beta-1,3-glucanase (GH17 family)